MANLIDFIPEGEDTGGYDKGQFVDFIPAPVPQKHEVVVEQPVVTPKPVTPVKPAVPTKK